MRRILWLAILLIATSMPGGALGQPAISAEIAPLGKLRFATNGGNQVLVRRTADGKISGGLAVDVGKFIAEKLGVSFELVAYANADAYTQSFGKGEWDVGFGPPTPRRRRKRTSSWIWCWLTICSLSRSDARLPTPVKLTDPELR